MAILNQRIAGRTTAEYQKEYRKNKKEKINARRNERRKDNPEKQKKNIKNMEHCIGSDTLKK